MGREKKNLATMSEAGRWTGILIPQQLFNLYLSLTSIVLNLCPLELTLRVQFRGHFVRVSHRAGQLGGSGSGWDVYWSTDQQRLNERYSEQ